mmetsp:Transcript_14218/g.38282  ORF Transcript_14218/g.38282 Transcript_14218/m.38282 type:complete len:282 (-) Transcript_14218:1456-2301(-)
MATSTLSGARAGVKAGVPWPACAAKSSARGCTLAQPLSCRLASTCATICGDTSTHTIVSARGWSFSVRRPVPHPKSSTRQWRRRWRASASPVAAARAFRKARSAALLYARTLPSASQPEAMASHWAVTSACCAATLACAPTACSSSRSSSGASGMVLALALELEDEAFASSASASPITRACRCGCDSSHTSDWPSRRRTRPSSAPAAGGASAPGWAGAAPLPECGGRPPGHHAAGVRSRGMAGDGAFWLAVAKVTATAAVAAKRRSSVAASASHMGCHCEA